MKKETFKRIAAFSLCLLMLFSLTACKSRAVKNVETLIAGLGEITADSQAAVEAAEAAYAALSDSDKAQVETAQKLTEARAALDEALKEAKRQAIIGCWDMELDGTDAMAKELAEQMDMDPEEFAASIGKFTFKSKLELKEDGTYRLSLDAESFRESMTTLFTNLKPIIRELMIKSIAKEFLGKEDGTLEELETQLGTSIDEFLKTFMGMTLDDLIDLALEQMNSEEYISSLTGNDKEGRYLIDLDKDILYFSESLDEEPDTANGEYFKLEDGIMKITDCFGEGFFEEFYPVTLTKSP